LHIALCTIFTGAYAYNSSTYVDSLIIASQSEVHDTVKLNTYFKLFNYYLKTDTAKALQYETVIIQIASKYNIHKHIVNMNTAKAMYYKDIANFEMSKVSVNRAILLLENNYKKSNYNTLVGSYLLLEWLYKMGNELDSSIVICNRGFELAKTNADSLNMVRLLLETASVYKLKYDYVRAREYLQKAYDLNIRTDNAILSADISLEIGLLLMQMVNYERGAEYLKRASLLYNGVDIKKYNNSLVHIAQCYNSLSETNLTFSDSAKTYINKLLYNYDNLSNIQIFNLYRVSVKYYSALDSIYLASRYIDSIELIIAGNNAQYQYYEFVMLKVSYCYKTQQYKQALQWLHELEPYLNQSRITNYYYTMSSEIYYKLGNYKKAFYYQGKSFNEYDSVIAELRLFSENEFKLNIKLQEQLLLDEAISHEINMQNQKHIRQVILSSSLIIITLLAFLFIILLRKYREKKRDNEELERRERIAKTLLMELNHRVKNNLQIMSVMLSLQRYSTTNSDAKEALKIAQGRIDSMVLLHRQLHKEPYDAVSDLHKYISDLTNSIAQSLNLCNNVKISINVSEVKIKAATAVNIGIILTELITNAFKYGIDYERDNTIAINVNTVNNKLFIQVLNNNIVDIPIHKNGSSGGLDLVRALAADYSGSVTANFNESGEVIVELLLD